VDGTPCDSAVRTPLREFFFRAQVAGSTSMEAERDDLVRPGQGLTDPIKPTPEQVSIDPMKPSQGYSAGPGVQAPAVQDAIKPGHGTIIPYAGHAFCDSPGCGEGATHDQKCKGCHAKMSRMTLVIQVVEHMSKARALFLNITVNMLVALNYDSVPTLEAAVAHILELVQNDKIEYCERGEFAHTLCGATYADILFSMRLFLPTFRVPRDPKPMTFTRILLNVVQDAFEALAKQFKADLDALEEMSEQTRNRFIALVSFIGHLFNRRLVASRVVAQIIHDLVGVKDRRPHENHLRCAYELLQIVGKELDTTSQGNVLMTQFQKRLQELTHTRTLEGDDEPLYSLKARGGNDALNEARFKGWPPRPATQILLKYEEVDHELAIKAWDGLKDVSALPPGDMHLDRAPYREKEGNVQMLISGVMTATTNAVVFNKNLSALTGAQLKEEISYQTSIHVSEIRLFNKDCVEVMDDAKLLSQAP